MTSPAAAPAPLLPPPAFDPAALQPFLRQAAQDLLGRYAGTELSELVVVVPTRRAVVYLKNELALAAPVGEALWSPRVTSMEDYMVDLAGVQVEEPIALQLLLFDILRELDPNLDFDLFTGWSRLLLDDFSNLDQNLADPASLFEYLSEAKALERWDLTDSPAPASATAAWFKFWDDLEKVYRRLRRRLKADNLAYPGLAYRLAVDVMQRRLKNEEPVPRHVFLGLGVLSRSEQYLLRQLQKAGKAEIRFDTDRFYLDGPNRAGLPFADLRKHLDLGVEALGFADAGAEDLLRTVPRQVRLIGVANNSMQGKVAGQLVAEGLQLDPRGSVAVVLPDETLLLPVLHGLPPEQVPQFNVTMGLSFRSTPLFNLIDLLFEVHLTGIREGETGPDYGIRRYHHLTVTKLLAHPFLRRYEQWLDQQPDERFHHVLDHLCRQIIQRNAVLLTEDELRELGRHHPLVEALFRPWRNCDDVVRACYEVIELLRDVYRQEHTAIEAEYLYLFYTLVRQLDSAFDCRQQRPSVRSFRRFLYEQMTRTRLPFAGEPIAQVQVMGLLETRALDFDHVVILSCNEQILPAPKRNNSLFPYDVLTKYGMPTYAEHEAATAHQFWRLLQRARRVDLVYILPGAEGVQAGERSRFLLQIEHDLRDQNPGLQVLDLVASAQAVGSNQLPVVSADTPHQPSLTTDNPQLATSHPGNPQLTTQKYEGDLVLEKDYEMQGAIRGLLERGLSASALNQFLTCSLQFYFSRIARFKEQDGVEEELGADVFGTAVHYVLEQLMTPFVLDRRPISADDVAAWRPQIAGLLERGLALDDGAETDNPRQQLPDEGLNHVLRGVGVRLVERYLDTLAQQLQDEGPLRVVGLEEGLTGDVTVETRAGDRVTVHLIGFADRVDELPDGRRRIIDYKTGSVHGSGLNLMGSGYKKYSPAEALERLVSEAGGGADKVRQLWLYRLMLAQRGYAAAEAAIVPLRSPDPKLLAADLSFLTAEGQLFEEASQQALTRLVDRMLDPQEPIRKTDDLNVCQYCSYKGICAR
ncbi:PD-(D/E)XK nuclease family protein [Hymenobacter jeollabukensis]|uniref:PD-(D/E)XK nuclease family protein n=1 Tax=Hymenobacter jeollabukensis TaxID=2025313 RepID=A0A5R8WPX2_9BACT|nr:PD-(D/E)XK nuclease family protein [Hymenobacter jeollabukensis]TLM91910.1 PD-(D/E)XK nuclease family protein [Hymenobacter jeollabukensis]